MGGIGRFFRSVFSFLGSGSSHEDRVAAYLIREHDRGRTMADILDDPYVTNRCSPQQLERLLDRPDVIHALGETRVAAQQQRLGES